MQRLEDEKREFDEVMGRKGGGQKGFMKAVLKKTTEETSPASNPPDVTVEHHQQIPGDIRDDLPVASETEVACAVANAQEEASAGTREPESKSQMQKRHQRELKALKRLSTKGGKKKEITSQLEEMRSRHVAELRELDSIGAGETSTVPGDAGEATLLPDQQHLEEIEEKQFCDEPALKGVVGPMEGTNTAMEGDSRIGMQKQSTRAHRRRQKAAEKEIERNARIAKELSEIGESARAVEERQLMAKLAPLGLHIQEIKPDGHCMYRALEDQLNRCSNIKDFQELRGLAAEYILSHKADFYPFMVQEEPGLGPDEALEVHCEKIKSTAQWGGEMELNALSRALKLRIIVHSAEMPDQIIGGEFENETQALRVCFMRHAFRLGDHYNSVVKNLGCDRVEDQESSWKSSQ